MTSIRRGALVGVGNVAILGHLPAWLARQDIQIVAATDVCPTRRSALQVHLPQARWYDSVDAMLALEQLDFVDICTPPATHAGLICLALAHGLHVLCEKPLVCDLADLDTLHESVTRAQRVLFTVHNWHHAPIIQKVRELLRQGAIGEVRRCVWQTLRTQPAAAADEQGANWRLDPAIAGGGILVDHGWHVFYVLSGWLQHAPIHLGARLESRRLPTCALEDTATIWLEFPATTAEVFLTWAADVRRNWAELQGTHGTIRLDDATVALLPSGSARHERQWQYPTALSTGSYHPDWFGHVASGFIAEISESTARGANLAEASLCVRLLQLAQESSRRGGEMLTVPEVSPSATAS